MSTATTAAPVLRRSRRGRPGPWGRAGAALVLLWLAAPLVPLLLWAFATRWTVPAAWPQDWGLRGWDEAAAAGLPAAAVRSLVLGVLVAAVATPLGMMAGRALGWREVRRPGVVALVLLAPVVLPPFAVSMGLDVIVLRLGVPDVVAVLLVLSVFALPYTSYTMRAAYRTVDAELEEQARVLGASARQARWRATLPAVRSGIVVSAGLAFLVGWGDYVVTLLIGGGQLLTVPVLIGSTAAGTGREATVAALSLASVLPPVAALLLARWWVRRAERPVRDGEDRR